MGLEGIGGGGGDDGGALLAAPGLAQKLEDEGTNEQNANILNLFLDSVTLPGGAPAPITDNVGSINVTSTSVVFNGNFTRERYGRAAVNDNITLEADKRSLLLDGNQTDTQKAQSILGALEFDNGVSAIQSMSIGDVTGTTPPANIDSFNRRPDAMFTNTARLNATKREHLAPSFTGIAEPEYVAVMVAQAGGTAGPTTFGQVVSGQTLMNQIAADGVASAMLTMHPNGIGPTVSSQTAMASLSQSQPAMQEVIASQTVMQEVAASQTAMQEVAASQTALQEVVASQTAMQEVAASQTAMQEVAASQTALQEVVASQTAMQEVANSQTALQEVAASQTAGDAVASSGTAVSVIEAASSSAFNSVPGPDNAPIYIAELRGGGGGDGDSANRENGTPGGDTTFHESTAEGGDGGIEGVSGKADSGNGISAPPDVAIDAITGGGASGGGGRQQQNGGDGGFVKALIMNPERDSLSLTVGNGGDGGPVNSSLDGDDGSATIFTPNIF